MHLKNSWNFFSPLNIFLLFSLRFSVKSISFQKLSDSDIYRCRKLFTSSQLYIYMSINLKQNNKFYRIRPKKENILFSFDANRSNIFLQLNVREARSKYLRQKLLFGTVVEMKRTRSCRIECENESLERWRSAWYVKKPLVGQQMISLTEWKDGNELQIKIKSQRWRNLEYVTTFVYSEVIKVLIRCKVILAILSHSKRTKTRIRHLRKNVQNRQMENGKYFFFHFSELRKKWKSYCRSYKNG